MYILIINYLIKTKHPFSLFRFWTGA